MEIISYSEGLKNLFRTCEFILVFGYALSCYLRTGTFFNVSGKLCDSLSYFVDPWSISWSVHPTLSRLEGTL